MKEALIIFLIVNDVALCGVGIVNKYVQFVETLSENTLRQLCNCLKEFNKISLPGGFICEFHCDMIGYPIIYSYPSLANSGKQVFLYIRAGI